MKYYNIFTYTKGYIGKHFGPVPISIEQIGSRRDDRVDYMARKRAQSKFQQDKNIKWEIERIKARRVGKEYGYNTKQEADKSLESLKTIISKFSDMNYVFDQYNKTIDAVNILENFWDIVICIPDEIDEDLKKDIEEYNSELKDKNWIYMRTYANALIRIKHAARFYGDEGEEYRMKYIKEACSYCHTDPDHLRYLIRKRKILEMRINGENPFLGDDGNGENEYFALIFAVATEAWLKPNGDAYEKVLPYLKGKDPRWLFKMAFELYGTDWHIFTNPIGGLITKYASEDSESKEHFSGTGEQDYEGRWKEILRRVTYGRRSSKPTDKTED